MDDEINYAAAVREDAVLDPGSILHVISTENKDKILPPLRVVATRQTACVVEQMEPPNVNVKGDDATVLDQGDSADDECATSSRELADLAICSTSSSRES